MPPGKTFISVEGYGHGAWSVTGRVIARDIDDDEHSYFLKASPDNSPRNAATKCPLQVAFGEQGRVMLHGEHESSKEIHRLMPDFISKPIAFGKYDIDEPDTYFYLSEYTHMDNLTAPDPSECTAKIAELHRMSQSPTNRFGFQTPTCNGKIVNEVQWDESWVSFFTKLLNRVCSLDSEANGQWPELERATTQIVTEVVPQLLGPLQSGDQQIKPCLIHGDLYEGNVGICMETGDVMLFDASSYYAHNEMELGHWRLEFSSTFRSKVYIRQYLQNFPAAEPADQFDDRNRLYSLKGALAYSASHPGSFTRTTYEHLQQLIGFANKMTRAYNNMCYLCEKYAPIDGIDTYDPRIDPSITEARIKTHERVL